MFPTFVIMGRRLCASPRKLQGHTGKHGLVISKKNRSKNRSSDIYRKSAVMVERESPTFSGRRKSSGSSKPGVMRRTSCLRTHQSFLANFNKSIARESSAFFPSFSPTDLSVRSLHATDDPPPLFITLSLLIFFFLAPWEKINSWITR